MASPTPALGQRVPPHLSPKSAAVQGAATAFLAHPTRNLLSTESPGTDATRSLQKLAQSPQAREDSELPPIGSVKDKIGRFAIRPEPSALSEPSRVSTRDSTATLPHSSEQSGAARPSPQKPPVPSRKPASILTSPTTRDKASPPILRETSIRDISSGAPEPRSTPTTNESHDASPWKSKDLPLRSGTTQRKPAVPPPRVQAPSQLAATKPRPVAPTSRIDTAIPTPPTPASAGSRTHNVLRDVPTPSSRSTASPGNPLSGSIEKKPALPPRSNNSPAISKDDLKNHRAMLSETASPQQASSPSISSPYGRLHNNSSSSLIHGSAGLDEEALSDAIVASSLASSRASSARRSPPPPPPQRRTGNRSVLHLHSGRRELADPARPSSPLRHTLRSPAKTREEVKHDHRHRRLLIHKHPHKHHEGDRKRWRDEIPEKARKRYEGVWAANKGLHVPTQEEVAMVLSMQEKPPPIQYPPNAADMVASVVVRDIWSRSRLPSSVLGQVWDLVDQQRIGLLTREEFVVGMWLIDQQLRGHKLPFEVPESVWASVNRVPGINVRDINFSS